MTTGEIELQGENLKDEETEDSVKDKVAKELTTREIKLEGEDPKDEEEEDEEEEEKKLKGKIEEDKDTKKEKDKQEKSVDGDKREKEKKEKSEKKMKLDRKDKSKAIAKLKRKLEKIDAKMDTLLAKKAGILKLIEVIEKSNGMLI